MFESRLGARDTKMNRYKASFSGHITGWVFEDLKKQVMQAAEGFGVTVHTLTVTNGVLRKAVYFTVEIEFETTDNYPNNPQCMKAFQSWVEKKRC